MGGPLCAAHSQLSGKHEPPFTVLAPMMTCSGHDQRLLVYVRWATRTSHLPERRTCRQEADGSDHTAQLRGQESADSMFGRQVLQRKFVPEARLSSDLVPPYPASCRGFGWKSASERGERVRACA